MKNILFVHSSSELYGSDRSLLNIVRNIDKSKYNTFVILPCEGPLVDEMKKIEGITVSIFSVAVLRRKNLSIKGGIEYFKEFMSSRKYLIDYINKHNIDLVDTNTAVVFPGAIAAKKCGVKSVWHIREIISSKVENRVISLMMNTYSDLIIANSKTTGMALNVNQQKIRVVYNAVDEKESLKKEHNGLVVGMAGRINRWKGQKLFVDAAKLVKKEIPDVKYYIAGDVYTGEEFLRDELISHIHDSDMEDSVVLLGQVNNMDDFYDGLDLFVLPSVLPEPFGLVVIEAMEHEIPVIATNHGGPTEIVEEGITGFLVSYEKPEEMASKMIELLSDVDKRKKFGFEGKRRKRNLFSVTTMVKSIENVFDELLC